MTNNQYPIYRVINLTSNFVLKTTSVPEVIHHLLMSEDIQNFVVLKEDLHGHRIIKLEGNSFDALEMCLLESIL